MENNTLHDGSPTRLLTNIKKTINLLRLSEKDLRKLKQSLLLDERLLAESKKAISESHILLHNINSSSLPVSLMKTLIMVPSDQNWSPDTRKNILLNV